MIGKLATTLTLFAGFVAGCATPEVVEVTRADDFKLTCAEIKAGIAEAEEFREAAQAEKGATGTNVAAIALFPIALLATYSNIEEATTAAMERKSHLAELYRKKGCDGDAVATTAQSGGTVTVATSTTGGGADYYDGLRAYDAGHHAAAATAWEVAARAGDAKAQYRLGQMHQSGQGVPQSYVKAHQFFNLAAAQGHAEAQTARDALTGQMTPEDVSRAQKLAEDWRTVQAEPQVAALESKAEAEQPVCGEAAKGITSKSELRRALVAYYRKHPIQRNFYGSPAGIKSIEKLKLVKARGNTLTIAVTYRARRVHVGTATVEACGSTYTVLSFV